jgi:hypothetical protein
MNHIFVTLENLALEDLIKNQIVVLPLIEKSREDYTYILDLLFGPEQQRLRFQEAANILQTEDCRMGRSTPRRE